MLTREEPLHTVASSDFGDAAAGPPIAFQPPMGHTIVAANKRKKGTFEKLFLEGRPPVAVGVTSGGDLFGGTQVTFTDVLGDKQFNLFIASVSQYRTMSFSYINLSRRMQYAVQAYSQTQFFYGYDDYLYGAAVRVHRSRHGAGHPDGARRHDLRHLPAEPLHAARAVRRLLQFQQEYNEPSSCSRSPTSTRWTPTAGVLFSDGQFAPLGINLVRETTIFREYGPLAGHTMYLGYEYAPSVGDLLSRQAVDGDARYYLRLGTNGVLALRAAATRAGESTPGTCTSAATPRCAATTTWRSSATRGSSPTPSCASRSSKPR